MGSRGDLQPCPAILHEMQRRGRSIRLIYSVNFEAITGNCWHRSRGWITYQRKHKTLQRQ
jgi:hypothetical protein